MSDSNVLCTMSQTWPPMDKSIIPENFRCPNCDSIIKDAVQAHDCGCQYCLQCLIDLTKPGADMICLKCKTKFESDQRFPDRNLDKKIRKFLNTTLVDCKYHGCGLKVSLENYQQHYFTEHEPQTLPCIYCGKEFTKKSVLDAHTNLLSGDCLEQPVECPYKVSGCKINDSNSMDTDNLVILRKNLDSHLNAHQVEHLKLVFNHLTQRMDNLEITTKNFNETTKQQTLQESSSQQQVSLFKQPLISESKLDLSKDSGIEDSRYNQSSSSYSNVSSGFGSSSVVSSSSASLLTLKSLEAKLADMNTKLDILENSQKSLITDINRLQKMNDNFKQQNQKYKEENKELKTMCQDLHRTLALTQVSLLTLEERLINQEKLSYNGTLLWKITNVQERIQEAKSGRQTSFYSPPFYTERNGFKMCARIYLNGDGNGRNTHLSLFFVILRGEYDALLKWPFRQKVTFILIDQSSSESKENVYDAFRPDPNSSSFRRPVSEMNIASGLPVFCPLGKLLSDDHEYIKDNTMFIKIIVDTKDLSEI